MRFGVTGWVIGFWGFGLGYGVGVWGIGGLGFGGVGTGFADWGSVRVQGFRVYSWVSGFMVGSGFQGLWLGFRDYGWFRISGFIVGFRTTQSECGLPSAFHD